MQEEYLPHGVVVAEQGDPAPGIGAHVRESAAEPEARDLDGRQAAPPGPFRELASISG